MRWTLSNRFLVFLYLILTSGIYYYLSWVVPMRISGLEFTRFQNELVSDSNYYLFLAREIARSNFEKIALANSTWLSQGVVLYGAFILWLTKRTIFIWFINKLLIFHATTILAKNYVIKHRRIGFMFLVFSLPFFNYYTNMLTKETLSFFLLASVLVSVKRKRYVSLLVFLAMLFFVRMNLLALVFAYFAFYWIIKKRRYGLLILLLLGIGMGYSAVLESVGFVDLAANFEMRTGRSALGVRGVVAGILGPTTFAKLVIFAPLRAVLWFYAPLPIVSFNFTSLFVWDDWRNTYVAYISLARLASALMLLFYTIKQRFAFRYLKNSIGLFVLIYVLVISTTSFVMGARYRSIIEPFFLLSIYFVKDNEANNLYRSW